MRQISLDSPTDQVWKQAQDGRKFIPLGNTSADKLPVAALDRIARRSAGTTQEVWGTLGPWDDASPKGWKGSLRLSNQGTESSSPTTSGAETVALIQSVTRTTAMAEYVRVRERFIDLSDLSFMVSAADYKLSEQPSLRLTLFVQPDEGALVYLQHGPLGEDGVDFIAPESTGVLHSCSRRDRLHYRIPLFLEGGLQSVREEASGDLAIQSAKLGAALPPHTALKILTFQRQNSPSHEVVRRALSRLGRDKHQLLCWNLKAGAWDPIAPEKVKRDVRTLLFLHGTFSSTAGSFGPLADRGTWSWLENIAIARQRYQQVLALDHDTVLEDLPANAQRLKLAVGGGFTRAIDAVTHSRGGLLAKHLAIYEPGFEIERAAMTACANGVGYMRTLQNVSRFLSVMRRLLRFSTAGDTVVALAQHSVEFVASLPGLKVMTPGSDELAAVMRKAIPGARTQTSFMPVMGDYDRRLVEQERFFKRFALNGLDLIIKAILGAQHDWVVGSANQAILANGYLAPGALTVPIRTWHTEYYALDEVRTTIQTFLLRSNPHNG